MDIKTFLTELLSSMADIDFVEDINLKAEGIVLRGRIILRDKMFLEVYYNAVTGTIAFALINPTAINFRDCETVKRGLGKGS